MADRQSPARDGRDLRRTLLVVAVVAVGVQSVFAALAVRSTGRVDGFALRSRDGLEFVRLARTLVTYGRYSQDEHPPFYPDTWRVPVYPLFLAACAEVFGDDLTWPILVQQVPAVGNVLLLVAIVSHWTSTRMAGVVGALWLLDPYRGYYTLWILSETCFTSILLVAVLAFQRWWYGGRGGLAAFAIGALTGLAAMTRPIAIVLAPLALLGVAAARGTGQVRLRRAAACLVGVLVAVGPWLVRNKVSAGQIGLTHITGTVLTYYKAVEIVLWSQGRADLRYDPEVVRAIWEQFDERLRERWANRYGPLSAEARLEIVYPYVTTGRVRAVNPLQLDREVLRLGLTVLSEHPAATVSCWLSRCVSILTFPLGLAIKPPRTESALPLAGMLPGASDAVRRVFAGLIALPFVVLIVMAAWRAIRLIRARQIPLVCTCLLPVLALLAATSPQLDPRFRLPMVPLLLLLAAARPTPLSSDATGT